MSSNVGLERLVHILSAVETRRTARTNTVGAQSLYGSFLDSLGVDEIEVVVGSKVGHSSAVRELRLGR